MTKARSGKRVKAAGLVQILHEIRHCSTRHKRRILAMVDKIDKLNAVELSITKIQCDLQLLPHLVGRLEAGESKIESQETRLRAIETSMGQLREDQERVYSFLASIGSDLEPRELASILAAESVSRNCELGRISASLRYNLNEITNQHKELSADIVITRLNVKTGVDLRKLAFAALFTIHSGTICYHLISLPSDVVTARFRLAPGHQRLFLNQSSATASL